MQKRNTIQRQLVISAVRSLSNHPTAEEVYNRIVLDYPFWIIRISARVLYTEILIRWLTAGCCIVYRFPVPQTAMIIC